MLVILVVTAFAMPASAKQVFTDLSPEHWCYSKIMDFEKKGYVCGYSDNTFRADRTITRAEYVKIVNNFFGYKPSEKTTSAFKDVNSGDWFMPYVNEAVDRGYIEGFEDGTFRPQDPIRRQEATVILARILKIDKEVYPADHKDGLAQYSDSDEVQEWARVAIHSYSVYNFINGYEDGTLRILRNVTRAETVELLHILEQRVVIDRKPGGGTKTPTLKPDIDVLVRNLIEVPVGNEIAIKEEYTPVIYTKSNWINKKNSTFEKEAARNGAFVNITSQTTGSTIHDTVDVISRKEEYQTTKRDEYDNKFFLTDGVYTVTAQATKSGRKDSDIVTKVVKIDTVAPNVNVVATSSVSGEVAHEQSVTVAIKDPNLYNANEISGLDKVAYAWFNADTDERVTVWSAFELTNGQAQINAPLTYGKYKLGIAAIDVAENAFGTRTEYAVKSEDISGDVPTTPSGDVDYDFVKETESGDENPSGEEIIVIVGNNNPTIEDLTMYTTVNEIVSGELKGKDIDSGDVLSYEINDAANYGTAEVDGNKTTYVSDKAGTYKYTVKVRDNHSGEAIGNVTVYVFDAEVKIPESPSGDEIKDPEDPTKPVNPDLSGEKLVLFVDEEKEMTASVTPSGSPVKDVKYAWSFGANEEKAEISSKTNKSKVTVKGLKPGETKITVKVDVEVETPSGDTKTVEIEKQITVIVLSRITIKIPDATKAYDGIALKAENFKVKSGDKALKAGVMADGDVAEVRVSGERLYVGSSDATLVSYDIVDSNNNSVRKYYVPTFEKGTLTVTANKKEIIITANSANKKYDGTALKNSGYTYTSGVLASGDVLEAVVSGEQLNAGSGDNKVISYKVTRNGQDVTGNYTFGESKNGVLEVTKRTITLTSASATKVYDGMPLISGDVTVSGDGFVIGEDASYDVTGTITNVGKVDNEFTYTLSNGTLAGNYEIITIEGTLEVTPITEEVIVKVKGNSASGDKYDGTEKSVEGYKVVEISNNLYSSGDVSYSGDAIATGTNAGTHPMRLVEGNFKNNSKNFTNVKFELVEDGKLVIAKRVIELISASAEKKYDGKPLTKHEVTVSGDGFVENEGADYTFTGTQTDNGSSENEFEYELKDGTSANNYEIAKTFGTLTVTKCNDKITVTITGRKDSFQYDGTEKKVEGYDVSIEGSTLYSESDFRFSGEAKVTATNVGAEEYKMELSVDNFKNTNDNFINLTFIVYDGSLTITKRDVTLTSATDEKEYDGTPLTNKEITVGGDGFVSGEGATCIVTGSQTKVGSSENKFTYTLTGETLESNYNITTSFGTLTVTPSNKIFNATITSDFPKAGKKAEPGDKVKYIVELEENSGEGVISYPTTITIKLGDKDQIEYVTELPDNAEYDQETNTIIWTLNDENDDKTLTYEIEINTYVPAGSDIITTIVSGANCENDHVLDVEETVSKSSEVDKNIILVLDVSSSMKGDKIKTMQSAANNFIDEVFAGKGSKNVTITLITFCKSVEKNSVSFDSRYDANPDRLKQVISNLETKKGTNISDAVSLALDTFDSNSMIKNGKNIMVFLSDGNALPEENSLNHDKRTVLKNKFLAADLTAFAIGVEIETDDLKTIAQKGGFYKANDNQGLLDAFDEIANVVNSMQTENGIITIEAKDASSIYPIHISHDALDKVIEDSSTLDDNNLTVDGKTVTWDISQYPGHKGFKIILKETNNTTTLELAALDFMIIDEDMEDNENIDEIIESGDTNLAKENTESGDVDTSKENETTTSGDTEIKNNDEIKSSETVSGEDKALDNKDVELDNNENEQQNEEKNQGENVDGKEENQKVDNENQVNEVEGKQDDDDSNDTSDSDKEIE